MKKEEAAIIELFRWDKEKAFEQMFEKYFSPLCVYASYYTSRFEEAEDLVQQLFVRFWLEDWQHRINSSLESFLKVSTRHACINHLEKEAVRHRRINDAGRQITAEQAFDFLISREQQLKVDQYLSALTPRARRAFELVYLEDESYASAANRMSVSLNTLKSHLKSALRSLRQDQSLKRYYSLKKNG
jgi:RNA polymerase sigma-70 factor (ECF subfamily)